MPLESVTPSPSVVTTDIVALHEARRLAATAKPIAEALHALIGLMDAAPAIQRVVASLQARESDLRTTVSDLEGLVTQTRERTTAEQRRLESDLSAAKAKHSESLTAMGNELALANDNHAKSLGDLKMARDKRHHDHTEALKKFAEDEQRTLIATEQKRTALTAEITALEAKRDGLKIEFEKLKAKYAE